MLFLQKTEVMELVAGNVERQAPHRGVVVVDIAPSQPSFPRQAAEESDRRPADCAVLAKEIYESATLETGGQDVTLFVEARERPAVGSGNAKGAVGKDALVVCQVSDDFLERPLPGRVGQPPDSMFIQRRQKRERALL